MKEYKVGDTIYVKGKVKAIDNTALPYCVDFGNGNNFIDFESGTVWVTSDNMIDELPTAEPVKPVLPKKVADELEYAKNHRHRNFYGYLRAASSDATSMDCPATTRFLDCFRGEKIKILSDAWYNAYTVEEKKYNLILGTDTDDGTNALFKSNPCTDDALGLNTDTYADDLKMAEFYKFTQKEIDKYNKDFWIKNLDLNDYKIEVTDDEQ